jgi:hydroxymethylpyrimidine/phosphomethylpyrimidine kinase
MAPAPPVVLTIAGFDPGSRAGVTADIKTIAAHECYGVACITGIITTIGAGNGRLEPVDAGLVADILRQVFSDVEVAAVHVGWLGSVKAAQAVAGFLAETRPPNIVLDPVLEFGAAVSASELRAIQASIEEMIPLAEVVTPNLEEAGTLTGMTVSEVEQMREAASRLHAKGAKALVITGGNMEKAIDLLSFTTARGVEQEVLKAERQKALVMEGTGSAFAAALACHLAQGRSLPEAVLLTKVYVSAAIANAYPLGRGSGPVHHLYRMNQQPRRAGAVAEREPSGPRT